MLRAEYYSPVELQPLMLIGVWCAPPGEGAVADDGIAHLINLASEAGVREIQLVGDSLAEGFEDLGFFLLMVLFREVSHIIAIIQSVLQSLDFKGDAHVALDVLQLLHEQHVEYAEHSFGEGAVFVE